MDFDLQPQEISTTWIENLALEELNMEESGVIHFADNFSPVHHLEEASIEFMDNLRDRFEIYITKFNEFRGNNSAGDQVRVFKISNTINDFMVYRNSLRLIVARKANDLISIGFLSSSGEVFSPKISAGRSAVVENSKVPLEIMAHLGPFNK
ncbi:MAG: hypothetical protein A2451_16830, partial [Bdellovibrionales bacterium RIFOXYC2_FULL_39_8]